MAFCFAADFLQYFYDSEVIDKSLFGTCFRRSYASKTIVYDHRLVNDSFLIMFFSHDS